MNSFLKRKVIVVFLVFMLVFNMIPSTMVFGAKEEKVRSQGFIPPKDSFVISSKKTTLVPGVIENEVQYNTRDGSKPVNGFIVDIDPNSDAKIMAASKDYNKAGTQTVRGMVEATKKETGRNIVAAINADLNWSGTGLSNGPLIIDDKIYSDKPDIFFGIKKDGQAIIGDRNKYSEVKDDLSQAIRGMGWLVRDGKVVSSATGLAPRTAVGIKEDGTVFFYVVEGRGFPRSVGVSPKELAGVMRDYGAVMALNLDGGGSTTYLAKIEGEKNIDLRNKPSDGVERPSISSLLVYAEEGDGHFHHATVDATDDIYTPNSEVQFKARGVDKSGGSADLPKDLKWKIKDKKFGSIDNSGKFVSSGTEGEVVVYLEDSNGKNVGEGSVEIRIPDEIHFRSDGFSLGFDETTDFGLRLTFEQRDVVYKDGDIKWEFDKELGSIKDNAFTSNPDKTTNGSVKATIANTDISKEFSLEIGKLPIVMYDFEDDKDNEQWKANYTGNVDTNLSIVHRDSGEPVRFGDKSLRMDFDFTNKDPGIGGAYAGFDSGVTLELPGSPTGVGMWIYGTEESQGLWLRTGIGVEGSPAWKAFDLTEEKKGIDWLGWKYVEVDLTNYSGPYPIIPGQFIRLMTTPNSFGGKDVRPNGSIYVDDITVTYGTNIDDHHAPIIDSVKVNDSEIGDDHIVNTNNITIETNFYDYEDDNATGIDHENVNIYIDGVNYKGKDGYDLDITSEKAYVYNAELTDGVHEIKVVVIDKAGNESTETRYITVDTGTKNRVYLDGDKQAVLGKDYLIKLKADEIDKIDEVNLSLKISDTLSEYDIEFSEAFEGTHEYINGIRMININAKRTGDKDADYIFRLKSKIDSKLNDNSSVSYNINIGEFKYKKQNTEDLVIQSFSTLPKRINVSAPIKISSEVIKVGEDGIFYVTDVEDNPVKNAEIFVIESGTRNTLGSTDENGMLVTDKFSEKATKFTLVAEHNENVSFEFNGQSFESAGNEDGMPFNIKSNAVKNPGKQQNITWFSNTSKDDKALIQYALESEYNSKKESAFVEKKGSSNTHVFKGSDNVNENYSINLNKVVIDGLDSGKKYVYRVGNGDKWSDLRRFQTIPNGSNMKFLVMGDIQTENYEGFRSDIKGIESYGKDYDFTLQVGDFVDNAGVYSNWDGILSSLSDSFIGDLDMIHVLGNHEYYGDPTGGKSVEIFNLPGKRDYYSVEYGNTYFGVINYTTNKGILKEALEWMVEDANKSEAKWKVLATHQSPYYANPQGGSQLFNDLVPAYAQEADIDFVISGHDHVYTRTKPLIDGKPDDDGVVYMIAGALGEKRYTAYNNPNFYFDEINDKFKSIFLSVETTEDEFKLDVRDLGNGKIIDSYTKTKASEEDDDDEYEEHDHDYYIEDDMAVCKICGDSIPIKDYTGFIKTKEEKTMYLVGGEPYTGTEGLLVLGGDKYFFDVDTGYAFTGKTEIWGLETEFDENGKLINGGTGFIERDNRTFYYDKLEMAKGWTDIGKDRYYFSNVNGYMSKGFSNVYGSAYVFDENGKLIKKAQPGFVKTDNGTGYVGKEGAFVNGWQEIDGYIYYFSQSDTKYMRTGNTIISGAKYEFGKDGKLPKNIKFGFNTDKGGTYYFDREHGKLSGWQEIDGNTYYFSSSNTRYMRTGFTTIEGKEYEFTKDGKLVDSIKDGFVETSRGTFYVDRYGKKIHGWKEIDGDFYYFSKSNTGYMRTGKTTISGAKYEFEKDGKLSKNIKVGFNTDKDGTFYFDRKHGKLSGWQEIEGNTYYFSRSNTRYMRTGITTIENKEYEFTKYGKLVETIKDGFIETSKGTFYVDRYGKKIHGWKEIDGNFYYFSKSNTGYMRTGKTTISGAKYEFEKDGKLSKNIKVGFNTDKDGIFYFDKNKGKLDGWQEIDGNTYYFSKSNSKLMRTGKTTIEGVKYEFTKDGKLIDKIESGFVKTAKGTYYLDKNGKKLSGWQEIDGNIYYFSRSNTRYMRTGKTTISGAKYEFEKDGKLSKNIKVGFNTDKDGTFYFDKNKGKLDGWQEIDGNTYYFSKSNSKLMRTGKTTIEGVKYEFTKDGKLVDKIKVVNLTEEIKFKDSETKSDDKEENEEIKEEAKLEIEFVEIKEGTYIIDEEEGILEGWYEIEEAIYYFSPKDEGYMVTGELEIDGIEYKFDEDGKLVDGAKNLFINTEEGTYYLDEEGEKVEGWYEIEEAIYYFSLKDEGYMVTGELEIDGIEYKFDEDGKLLDEFKLAI